jgi:hypothetical protein
MTVAATDNTYESMKRRVQHSTQYDISIVPNMCNSQGFTNCDFHKKGFQKLACKTIFFKEGWAAAGVAPSKEGPNVNISHAFQGGNKPCGCATILLSASTAKWIKQIKFLDRNTSLGV